MELVVEATEVFATDAFGALWLTIDGFAVLADVPAEAAVGAIELVAEHAPSNTDDSPIPTAKIFDLLLIFMVTPIMHISPSGCMASNRVVIDYKKKAFN